MHKENLVNEGPSEKIFTRMLNSLAFVSEERSVSTLSKAVAVPTDFNDSHPSLADRLRRWDIGGPVTYLTFQDKLKWMGHSIFGSRRRTLHRAV